jgi:hypothetical protein
MIGQVQQVGQYQAAPFARARWGDAQQMLVGLMRQVMRRFMAGNPESPNNVIIYLPKTLEKRL